MANFKYKGRGMFTNTGLSHNSALGSTGINSISIAPGTNSVGIIANQLNTISLSSIEKYDSDGLFSNPLVKKYEVYELDEDLLTLSSAWKRIRESREPNSITKLLDRELFTKLIPQDKESAVSIRDYYSKKIMMAKLKGTGRTTAYRDDLNTFIHSDGKMFRENMLGLAYYLPYFHEYDMSLDEVRIQVESNQNFDRLDKEGKPMTIKLTASLTPVKKLFRHTRSSKIHQYWFKDNKLNAGVLISVLDGNQLQHLWDYIFNNERELSINGMYTRRRLDGFEYFSVRNWEIDRT
jgi:hypothetical protein